MMRLPYNCPVPPCFGVDRWDIWDASDVWDVWGVGCVGCGTCRTCGTCGVWDVLGGTCWVMEKWWGSVLYSYEDR